MRDIKEIENELDELQSAYLEAEEEHEQMKLESKFMQLLKEATETDGKDRISANVTITNWSREID
jgi:hypothetical protein